MVPHDTLALLIAAVGLIVSVVSLIRTRKLSAQQLRLQMKQEELTDLQLELLRKQVLGQPRTAPGPPADVRISLEGFVNRARFVITNWGRGSARNIRLQIRPRGGRISPFIESDYNEKIPVKELAPGGRCALVAVITSGTGTTFDATWKWTNSDGSEEERASLLTVQ